MAYLLDANVFISAKNLHYGFDFCPAFWDWIIINNASGRVFSIEKVGDEVLALGDDLSVWADACGTGSDLDAHDHPDHTWRRYLHAQLAHADGDHRGQTALRRVGW